MIKKIFKEIGIFIALTIACYLVLLTVMYTTADIDKTRPMSQAEKTCLTIIIPIISCAFAAGIRLWYKYVTLPERARWTRLSVQEKFEEQARLSRI